MMQRQRLKFFGHIIRMKDDRQLKQLLFGEIDGVRFRGRPNMQWIDCISEDLKTFNFSNNPKEEWPKIRELALDRVKWKSLMEGVGMNLVVIQWMAKNSDRRKKRIIRQGIDLVQCDLVENMEFEEGEGIIRNLQLRKIEQEVAVEHIELKRIVSKSTSEEKPTGR